MKNLFFPMHRRYLFPCGCRRQTRVADLYLTTDCSPALSSKRCEDALDHRGHFNLPPEMQRAYQLEHCSLLDDVCFFCCIDPDSDDLK